MFIKCSGCFGRGCERCYIPSVPPWHTQLSLEIKQNVKCIKPVDIRSNWYVIETLVKNNLSGDSHIEDCRLVQGLHLVEGKKKEIFFRTRKKYLGF